MHIAIRELSLDGKDQLVGTLRLVDGKIVAEPAERELLQGILAEPVFDPKRKEVLTAETKPEEFLRALPLQYKSAYLRAILIEEPRINKTWDEGKHPREPAGSEHGGEWTSRDNDSPSRDRMMREAVLNASAIDAAKDGREVKESEPGYVYHYTLKQNLEGIGKEGLGKGGRAIYATEEVNPKIAEYIFSEADPEDYENNVVVLRFPGSKGDSSWRPDAEAEHEAFLMSDKPVSPTKIEIKTVFGWKPLVLA